MTQLRAELAAEKADKQQAIDSRDKAKARVRELEGSPESPVTTAKPEVSERPEWALTMLKQLDDLSLKVSGGARTSAMDVALEGVPKAQRGTARAVLVGLEADGDLDLSQPGSSAAALAKLEQDHSGLFADHTRAPLRSAPQLVNGKVDYSSYRSYDEVPPQYRGQMPDDVFKRLSGMSTPEGGRRNQL